MADVRALYLHTVAQGCILEHLSIRRDKEKQELIVTLSYRLMLYANMSSLSVSSSAVLIRKKQRPTHQIT